MSIVRVGLAETKGFADGYDAIFGGKKDTPSEDRPAKKKPVAKKKPAAKKAKKK